MLEHGAVQIRAIQASLAERKSVAASLLLHVFEGPCAQESRLALHHPGPPVFSSGRTLVLALSAQQGRAVL